MHECEVTIFSDVYIDPSNVYIYILFNVYKINVKIAIIILLLVNQSKMVHIIIYFDIATGYYFYTNIIMT